MCALRGEVSECNGLFEKWQLKKLGEEIAGMQIINERKLWCEQERNLSMDKFVHERSKQL